MEIQFFHMFQEPFPFNTFFGAARRDGDWHACPYFSNFLCLGFGVHSIRVSLFSPILRTNSRLLACVRSFGVRQLAAAFSPASLLAGASHPKPVLLDGNSTRVRNTASKLARRKAAASCRTLKLRTKASHTRTGAATQGLWHRPSINSPETWAKACQLCTSYSAERGGNGVRGRKRCQEHVKKLNLDLFSTV